MKKVISIFLLAAVLLAWTAPVTRAQHKDKFTAAQANAILQKAVGHWQIKSVLWQPWQNKFAYAGGNAIFSNGVDGSIVESLELEQPDGTVEKIEGRIRYSELSRLFEFVQVDKKGNSTLVMLGEWNPDFNMIAFRPIKGQKHHASKMVWQYFFFDDGSFKKVIRTPDGRGNSIIAAEFHCQQPKVANSEN